jgi:hypothetical protein
MGKSHRNYQGDAYIAQYPKLQKWIIQCVACKKQGYRPDLPEQIGIGVAAQNIRYFFRPIILNEDGICDECQQALLGTLEEKQDIQHN